ncbi:MAG: AAA family ATPase [Eubacterium sp.]
MIVTKIELSNFRNYDSLSLELDDKTNILYGKNAQGKTNVLEAIYLCSTTKSHRSSKDAELIKFENNEGHIKLFINKKGREYRIDIHLRKISQKE